MQLFISHSGKDREWVELVCKRIEAAGFTAYLAEYDIAGIGQELTPKLCDAITASAATVVILTDNAAGSPIVREEIGFALGQGKLVVPLVTPPIARNPAALGMLNGREYIPFDIDEPHDGLIKLTRLRQPVRPPPARRASPGPAGGSALRGQDQRPGHRAAAGTERGRDAAACPGRRPRRHHAAGQVVLTDPRRQAAAITTAAIQPANQRRSCHVAHIVTWGRDHW